MDKIYSIVIEKPNWEGYKYGYSFSKNYGDFHGGYSEAKTKEDLLKKLRAIVHDWNGFDYIVHREANEVTMENVEFESFTTDITLAEILGNAALSSWQ